MKGTILSMVSALHPSKCHLLGAKYWWLFWAMALWTFVWIGWRLSTSWSWKNRMRSPPKIIKEIVVKQTLGVEWKPLFLCVTTIHLVLGLQFRGSRVIKPSDFLYGWHSQLPSFIVYFAFYSLFSSLLWLCLKKFLFWVSVVQSKLPTKLTTLQLWISIFQQRNSLLEAHYLS